MSQFNIGTMIWCCPGPSAMFSVPYDDVVILYQWGFKDPVSSDEDEKMAHAGITNVSLVGLSVHTSWS